MSGHFGHGTFRSIVILTPGHFDAVSFRSRLISFQGHFGASYFGPARLANIVKCNLAIYRVKHLLGL